MHVRQPDFEGNHYFLTINVWCRWQFCNQYGICVHFYCSSKLYDCCLVRHDCRSRHYLFRAGNYSGTSINLSNFIGYGRFLLAQARYVYQYTSNISQSFSLQGLVSISFSLQSLKFKHVLFVSCDNSSWQHGISYM